MNYGSVSSQGGSEDDGGAQGREAEGAVGQVRWDACGGSSGMVLLWGWELSNPEF